MIKITRRYDDKGDPIPLTIIAHDKCLDGFTAAWMVRIAQGDRVIFTSYGLPAPRVNGENVVIVDFSYPRAVMQEMAHKADSMMVLDHHKSALDELEGLPYARFDMNKSGAMLAYEWMNEEANRAGVLNPKAERRRIVEYVQDRDLWRHALPYTKEVNAYLRTVPNEFEEWNRIATMLADDPSAVAARGDVALKARAQLVNGEAERAAWCFVRPNWWQRDRVYDGVIVNGCPALASDTCAEMLATHALADFAIVWHTTSRGEYSFSIRSRTETSYAATIAKLFGGGGHPAAAGARVKSWPKMLRRG